MRNFLVLTESIQFIEENLCEPITRKEIAKHCYSSLSTVEKLFRYALGVSMRDYISKRRMTQAAKDLTACGMSVTEVAMKYQFGSPEAFSRAFKRVWNVNPSEFGHKWKFNNLFPKIEYEHTEGEDLFMARKKVDFSEAYEYFKNLKGTYVLCFDGQHFAAFNEISHRAGDLAILEIAARIERAASDEMMIMRIGGDEFALVTGLDDLTAAQALSQEILGHNGEPVLFEGKELPLSLWGGITKIPESLRYSDFFTNMHKTIIHSKQP